MLGSMTSVTSQSIMEAMQMVDGSDASAEDKAKGHSTRLMFAGTVKRWQEGNDVS
jgi:hypothetical protein